MRGFKFNFITVLAFVLLVVYAYFASMGALYHYEKFTIPQAGVFFIAVIAIVSICIYTMCRARATRWEKVGIPTQVVLGVVIVVTFFSISIPFSSYVTVIGQQESVYREIDSVVTAAKKMNAAYLEYADNRLTNYQPREKNATRKEIRIQALRMQLTPPDLRYKLPERDKWLDKIIGMKISNVQMPNNLKYMNECVGGWLEDFKEKSSVVFEDEFNVVPFYDDSYKTQSDKLSNILLNGDPSWWALLAAIICSVAMLIPYFTTIPDFALRGGSSNDGLFDKWKKMLIHSDAHPGESGKNQDSDDEEDYM